MKNPHIARLLRRRIDEIIPEFEKRHGCKPIMLLLHPGVAELLFDERETAAGIAQFDELLVLISPLVAVPELTTVESFRWDEAKADGRVLH